MFITTRIGVAVSKAPPTSLYTALNPSDKGPGITLSNGNLTATSTTTASLCRTVKPVGPTEHKYWEVKINAIGGSGTQSCLPGIISLADSNANYPGSYLKGFSYAQDGAIINDGRVYDIVAPYAAGDIIGFALNRSTGTMNLYKNGTLVVFDVYAGSGGYPAFGARDSVVTLTFNFGPTMAYAIPSGASLITS